MAIDKEVIDKLLADYKGPEDLIGEQGLLKATDQGAGGAGDASRADAPLGLRQA